MFCDILISSVTFFVIFGGLTDKQTVGPTYLGIKAPCSYLPPFQTSDKKKLLTLACPFIRLIQFT